MRKQGARGLLSIIVLLLLMVVIDSTAYAQYSGSSYKIEEAQVGATGGDNDLTSGNFRGRAGVGDTAVGLVAGATYQAVGGFTTSDVPELEVSVNTPSLDLGQASATSTITGTANFGVRVYLASGYVVYTRGGLPTNGNSDTVPGMASTGPSAIGTEQFGINLVANTSPIVFGAVPQQLPDASFSFGSVAANYNTANNYRYVDGEAVAQSTQSSGVTNYTISYIVNISPLTKAGVYTVNHQMIVVATY
jgi:hypothetical protein